MGLTTTTVFMAKRTPPSDPHPAAASRPKPADQPGLVRAQPVTVKILVSQTAKPASKLAPLLLSTALLLAMVGMVVGGSWVAIQLIVNPGTVPWLAWLLPEWNRRPLTDDREPQTLAAIQTAAAQDQQLLGTPFALSSPSAAGATTDWLLPVLARRPHCQTGDLSSAGCGEIVELRVYRPVAATLPYLRETALLQLIDRISVSGPEEFFVIAPLLRSASTHSSTMSQGSSRALPLDRVVAVPGMAPEESLWFHLTGKRVRGNSRALYGQLIQYSPTRGQLLPSQPWTSPAEALPAWQEVSGGGTPELVVDQSIGLEPQYQVYQLVSPRAAATRLVAVSLTEKAASVAAYDHSLILARNGLWSPALKLMQTVKQTQQNSGANWPAQAQAQLDLIALHAQQTQTQADQTWASPPQQMMAQIIDGRWTKGLEVLQAAMADGYDMTSMLSGNRDPIWNRVTAALRVDPKQPEAQLWGALVVAAQQGQPAAIAWLRQQQTATTPVNVRLQAVLNRSSPQLSTTTALATSSTPQPSHASRLLGSVTPLPTVNTTDWLSPDGELNLATGAASGGQPAWYQIQVASFYDGQRWRRSPFSDLPSGNGSASDVASLWATLGLAQQPSLQILIWSTEPQPQTIQATVRALRRQGDTLQLLAAADMPPASNLRSDRLPSPLAITLGTLPWIEPTGSLTLADLQLQQPDLANPLLAALWQDLRRAGLAIPMPMPAAADLLGTLGHWPVQLIDLTGNGKSDAMVTVRAADMQTFAYADGSLLASSNGPIGLQSSRTVIFSDRGALLYSELGNAVGLSLVAIANLAPDRPGLILEGPDNYSLRRWSEPNQRFEE